MNIVTLLFDRKNRGRVDVSFVVDRKTVWTARVRIVEGRVVHEAGALTERELAAMRGVASGIADGSVKELDV